MAEPSEDEILQKAKELCRDDDKLWDLPDLQSEAGANRARLVSDSDRTEYLNRAKSLLTQKSA
jgi:hypothetical protein